MNNNLQEDINYEFWEILMQFRRKSFNLSFFEYVSVMLIIIKNLGEKEEEFIENIMCASKEDVELILNKEKMLFREARKT